MEKWNLREWISRNILKVFWANIWHKSKKKFYSLLTRLYKNVYEKQKISKTP